MKRLKLITFMVTFCVFVSGFGPTYSQSSSGNLTVHFINVGQGNATLLSGPDFTLLIDAGRQDGNEVVPYLQSVGVKSLDLLVGTHPHADHIGQFPQVLSAFPVFEVWMSGDSHTTSTFEQALDAILASGAAYAEPRAGEVYTFGSATVEVLNPSSLTGDLQNDSIVLRVVFGSVVFLFPGDAEAEAEGTMVQQGRTLRSQVLELGHHGSATSSSMQFLQAVQPQVAIYSAGLGNSYGHPSGEVLDRLAGLSIAVYGTDQYGSIQIITDGQTYRIQSGQGEMASSSGSVQAVVTPISTPPPSGPAYTCDCSKTCPNMASCEEAYYQLQQCGCGRRDGDGDGVPCETICPGG